MAWITQREAAVLLGCHKSRVAKLVAQGLLTSRGTRSGSLNRRQVEQLAAWRAAAPERAEVARDRRQAEREAARVRGRTPDTVHEWFSVPQAAQLLGVSRVAVGRRCHRGTLPHTWFGGRRWIRRDLLELVERARRAQRTRRRPLSP